jgi:metal-responsive CopG/Arc/MetJ family transcriptional regulator
MEVASLKHHIGLTIDSKLLREIEDLRGREKRSTFIEHLIRLGLRNYNTENKVTLFKN